MSFNKSGPPWVVSIDSWQTAAQALVSGGGIGPLSIVAPDGTDVGDILTATPTTGWVVGGYQWTRDGVDIGGATTSTYTLDYVDAGALLGCRAISPVFSALFEIPLGDFPAGQMFYDSLAIYFNGSNLSYQ